MNQYIIILLITATVGLVNTIYLSYCAITNKAVACWFFPAVWCRKVQYSSYSKTMGISNPYLGLGMLVVILVLIYLFLESVVPFWMIFSVSAGFLFSLYFTYIQVVVIKALCTWCVVSALVFTVLFVTSLLQMQHIYSVL